MIFKCRFSVFYFIKLNFRQRNFTFHWRNFFFSLPKKISSSRWHRPANLLYEVKMYFSAANFYFSSEFFFFQREIFFFRRPELREFFMIFFLKFFWKIDLVEISSKTGSKIEILILGHPIPHLLWGTFEIPWNFPNFE